MQEAPVTEMRFPAYLFFKRFFDAFISAAILVMLLPATVIIIPLWAAIIRSSPVAGNVHIGKNRRKQASWKRNEAPIERRMNDLGGKPFRQYRFSNPSTEQWNHMGKISKSFVLFLNKTGAVEIPMIINVLRGDMSIVGPRPDPSWLMAGYNWFERRKFNHKPGLTGLWQVYGFSGSSDLDNLQFDLYYTLNASIRLDARIIIETLSQAFRGGRNRKY